MATRSTSCWNARDGGVLAFEVKAAGRVPGPDMRHLRKLRDALGERFLAGVALYTGDARLPLRGAPARAPDRPDLDAGVIMAGLSKVERLLLAAVAVTVALAGAANYGAWAPVPRFALATVALAGLAWAVALGTEQLGEHIGAAATGVLQATLGNLPELLVVMFALKAGELVVAQTALVGSLLASALLVLGLTIVAGARQAPDGIMRFSSRLPNDATTLLLVTVFLIVLIGLALSSGSAAGAHVDTISVVGACCLLGVYATWLVPYLRPKASATGDSRAAAAARSRRASRCARRSCCWWRRASARASSRSGSSTRCARRSRSCTSPPRSPAS